MSPSELPSRIGRYAIVGVLGEGGMGTVYEAQQENPRRAVALKVIRAGFLSSELLRRFTRESQVLARLQHAGIAQVYEAGMAKDERGHDLPFFAMEFVQGVPLTEHARRKGLGTRERLELIAKVSDAVEHAHQKGVIHRDLKPGNILVDASGEPKILDFGIARATDSDIQQTSLHTDIGQLIGTIPYMSPEQVGGDPNELDTRSDVYALGVITYEILAGKLPYDLAQKMIHESARIIREEEPTRLSSVNRSLRGDVETIVGKALEKDKVRRYQSAESFASDIRRYLRDEPIAARPASTWYQLQKFSRRNTGLVVGVAAALVLLIAGIVGTGIALRRALEAEGRLSTQLAQTEAARAESDLQRRLAETNAVAEKKARARAEAINDFVTKALKSGDPMDRGKQDTTIAQAMDNAVQQIESGAFEDDPETEVGLLGTIGNVLTNDGKYARAEEVLERALSTGERVLGEDSPKLADILGNLAQLRVAQSEDAQAEPLLERSLAILEKTSGPDSLAVATALNSLGQYHFTMGRLDRAEVLYARALAIREKASGPESREVAITLNDLALIHSAQEEYEEAEAFLKRALSIFEKTLGPDHPDVATALNSLALLYEARGDLAQAEAPYVRALSICEKTLGPDHPLVATALHNLAELYRAEGEYSKAEPLYTRALSIREKALGPDHVDVAIVLSNLAKLYDAQGSYAQSVSLNERVLAIDEKAFGPEHAEVAADLHSLARVHEVHGEFLEAEPLYARAVAIREKVLGPDAFLLAISLNNLALTRQGLGKTVEARRDFDVAIGILRRGSPEGSATLARMLWISAKARIENEDAAGALPELEESVAMAERSVPPEPARLADYRATLAACKATLAK